MGVEDIITAGKVASKLDEAADAAKAAKVATKVSDLPRVKFPYKGVEYSFPPGTTREDAIRFLWKSGIGPGKKGEEITLPSKLTPERLEAVRQEIDSLQKQKDTLRKSGGDFAELLKLNDKQQFLMNAVSETVDTETRSMWQDMIKESAKYYERPKADVIPFPKKLDPGIYVDEDTGKYFKIDKDGNMEPINEAP